MKKILVFFLLLFLSYFSFAQTDTSLVSLKERLDRYNAFNKSLNFRELMDYIHPSIYKLAPKEELIQAFTQAFNNDQIAITIDSIAIVSIGSDFFLHTVQYKKVDYFMSMKLMFKDDESNNDAAFIKKMSDAFKAAFATKTVNFSKETKAFEIKGNDVLVAIKDTPKSNWMFLGYDPSNEATRSLFPKELVEHFGLK